VILSASSRSKGDGFSPAISFLMAALHQKSILNRRSTNIRRCTGITESAHKLQVVTSV
jgi:hypothetical protein